MFCLICPALMPLDLINVKLSNFNNLVAGINRGISAVEDVKRRTVTLGDLAISRVEVRKLPIKSIHCDSCCADWISGYVLQKRIEHQFSLRLSLLLRENNITICV